jgi:hypothetical protein
MKHFTDEAWLDFARRMLSASDMESMQVHLDQGCESCGRLCQIWQAVTTVIGRESQYEPPEPVVRLAKASYAARRRTYIVPKDAKMAPLMFDSYCAPAVAGVRSASPAPRHLLHRVGPWAVDLRLESLGANRICVAGQILRAGRKGDDTLAADVFAIHHGTLVAQTSANQFGEFLLECEHHKDLRLFFDIPGRRPVGIALPDPGA